MSKLYTSLIDQFLSSKSASSPEGGAPDDIWMDDKPASSIQPAIEDWRGKSAKVAKGEGDDLLSRTIKGDPTSDIYKERAVSDEEIKKYIDKLLNDGVSPAKVASRLNKIADNLIFNRQLSSEYLNNQAGILGYAYIQPNAYMDSCPSTYERMTTKLGGVKAKSVKQISACAGCVFFKNASGNKTCGLYHLPIVGSEKDLKAVIASITTDPHPKQALVKLANKETSKTPDHTPVNRVASNLSDVRKTPRKKAGVRKFASSDVSTKYASGETLEQIYYYGSKLAGSAAAKKAVQGFLDGLKKAGTKIALSRLDCRFLKNKLATTNAIIGEAKCASCVFRNGMHCGLTGGTLLSFPGMEKVKKMASKGKDGTEMVKEFGLEKPSMDIDFVTPEEQEIDLGHSPKMDL